MYLESKPSAHFVCEDLGDYSVKGRKNLHGELRLNSAFIDQVIEGVGKGQAQARIGNGLVNG